MDTFPTTSHARALLFEDFPIFGSSRCVSYHRAAYFVCVQALDVGMAPLRVIPSGAGDEVDAEQAVGSIVHLASGTANLPVWPARSARLSENSSHDAEIEADLFEFSTRISNTVDV